MTEARGDNRCSETCSLGCRKVAVSMLCGAGRGRCAMQVKHNHWLTS